LLGFRGEDDGPVDKEKITMKNAGGKVAQMGEERQQQLDLNPEAFPSL
jgi:hypothetical protein